MNGITIVSKFGGVSSSQPWGDIQIGSASSVIKISVSPHDVYQMARSGQDLVITTKTGETITLRGYFNATADGADHDIVFEDGDGVLWLAEYVPSPSSYAFQEIASINELLLTSGGAETAAGWFWPLGALGATSAIWENRGGRDSASRPDKPSARLGRPSPPTEVSINEDGSVITGRGEEGATVIVSDPNGNVIGTGLVGADGSFNLDINPPQNDGETLTVVVRNPEGGQSDPVIITAPGGAEEEQPDDGESEPTPTSESPDGEDGQPDEDENEGTGGEQPDEELPDDDDPDRDGETEEPETEDPDSPVDNEAPDAPVDLAVNADGTVLTGRGEPATRVEVRGPSGNLVGAGSVNTDGSFAVTLQPAQTNGQQLAVTLTDSSNLTSLPALVTAPLVDAPNNDAPDAATNLAITPDGSAVTGRGEPGATITITTPDGAPVGMGTVQSDGTFNVPLTPPQTNGETLAVVLSNGNGSSDPVTITAPVVNLETIPDAAENLAINAAGTVVTGTGKPDSTVEIRDASGTLIGTGDVDAQGDFSVTLQPAKTDGSALTVTLTNSAGSSPATTIQAPKAPDQATDLAISSDGTTLTGKGDPGATVRVHTAANVEVGNNTTVNEDGSFTIPLNPPQTDGGQLGVVLSNATGASPVALVNAPLVDNSTSVPDAPENLAITSDGIRLSGEGEPNAAVIVTNAGVQVGSGIVQGNGSFVITLDAPQIDGGLLSVVLRNGGGNSLPGQISAPKAPDVATNVAITGDGEVVTGDGEVNARVEVRTADGQMIGNGTVQPSGSFTVTLTTAQTQGGSLSVVLINATGESPAAPITAPDLSNSGAEPEMATDLAINVTGTILTGKGEPNATVVVRDAGSKEIGTALVSGDGTFTVTLISPQIDGGELSVVVTNPHGNSDPANISAPKVPDPATDLIISADGAILGGNGEPQAKVRVYDDNDQLIGEADVNSNGTFDAVLNSPQAPGEELRVILSNATGQSQPASITVPPFDNTGAPPAMPDNLTITPDGKVLTGTGEAGAVVRVVDINEAEVGRGIVLGDNTFSLVLDPPQIYGDTLAVILSNTVGDSPAGTVDAPKIPDAATDLELTPNGVTLTGKATTGLDVIVRNAAGEVVGTGTVVSGEFTVALTPVQNDGGTLSVVVKNATGESPAQTITAPKVPDAPSDLALSNDGATLTGKGEVGARVEVRDSTDQVVGDITVTAPDGSFEITFAPPQNQGGTLSVAQSNAAGSSPAVSLAAPKAPDAPVELEITPNGATVSGKGEAGAEVKVYTSANALVGEGWVDSDGTFSIDLTSVQNQGGTLLVTLSNPAGASPAAPLLAPSVPEAPIDLQVSPNGVTLTGKGEANASAQVKNAAGDVVGNTTVNADGTFTVLLNPPQIAGESLSVVLTNAAGSSVPQTVTAPLVEAIEAFDNLVEAHIDLLPAVEQTIDPSAFYGIDIDLLGIDLQLLSRPVISFTVAPGHRSDVELVYDTLAELNLLNDLKIGVQVKNASGQWEAVQGGSGDVSFLELKLLASNAKGATLDSLPAGEYRAFLHSEAGVLSADVVGTLNSSRTIYDYTDIQGVTAVTASGNVLTDTGLDNKIDDITANTIVARVNNTDIPSGGLTINGAYGQLVIQQNGSYTYTPNESANNIGKVDSFTYLIRDTQTGVQDTASLYVRLDSNSADLVWDGPTNSATTGLQAVDDTAMTQLTYGNKVTDPEIANLGSFSVTPILGLPLVNLGQSGAGSASFSVAEDSLADVTFYAVTTGILEVAASFSITVEQRQGSSWVVIDQVSDNGLLTLPLLGQERSGIALTVVGLEAGEYRISATNETLVSLGSSYDVNIFADPLLTHLDEYVAAPHPGVTGNILDGDSLGSMATKLLMNVGGTYTQVTSAGLTLDGAYGSLQVNADGSYVYSPDINRHHLTDVVETFTYALQHPNGEISTATLQITLEVSGAGIASSSFDQFAMGSDMLELDFDLVAGMGDEEVADEPEPDPDLTLGDLIHAPTAEISFASFEEGAQDEWVELSSANLEPAVVSDPFLVESPVHNDDLWNQPENQFG